MVVVQIRWLQAQQPERTLEFSEHWLPQSSTRWCNRATRKAVNQIAWWSDLSIRPWFQHWPDDLLPVRWLIPTLLVAT